MVINAHFNKKAFTDYLKTVLKKEEIPVFIRMDELPRHYPSQKINQHKLIEIQNHTNNLFFEETSGLSETTNSHHHNVVKKIWCELFEQDNLSGSRSDPLAFTGCHGFATLTMTTGKCKGI